MQTHANTGEDAYETLWRGRIKGAIKAKSECVRFPLTLTLCEGIIGAPPLVLSVRPFLVSAYMCLN